MEHLSFNYPVAIVDVNPVPRVLLGAPLLEVIK